MFELFYDILRKMKKNLKHEIETRFCISQTHLDVLKMDYVPTGIGKIHSLWQSLYLPRPLRDSLLNFLLSIHLLLANCGMTSLTFGLL